jgi:hypothetical protein
MGVAIPIPRSTSADDPSRRLKRLRALSWLLDRSIPIGRWRIGLDPILGMIPAVGDWVGAVLSLYIVYQAARLGIPARHLARMGGNILLEALVGTVPLLGDLFDFAWQANSRNVTLIERHHRPAARPRSTGSMWLMLGVVCLVVLATIAGLVVLFGKLLEALMQG